MATDGRAGGNGARRGASFALAFLVSGFFFTFLFAQGYGVVFAGDKAIAWKPSDNAMLRVDDRPVAEWNVYQAGKKISPLLVEMGKRYLVIDQQKRQIFELDSTKIEHRGSDLYWDPADRPEKPLETSEWYVRDVGLAYKVSAKLVAENHVIDVQIPHPLDLRSIH